MPTLIIAENESAPTRIELDAGEYTIGRDADNAIAIDEPTVSQHHCVLQVSPQGWLHLRDLGSCNGTWLNGSQIDEARLSAGQSFVVGTIRIRVEPAPVRTPPPIAPRAPLAPLAPQSPLQPCGLPLAGSFFRHFLGIWQYPFKGEAYVYILMVVGLDFLQAFIPDVLGIVGALIGFILGIYLLMVFQQIILSTIDGKDQFPDFPQFSLDWQENLGLYLHYFALVFICFGLAIVCNATQATPPWTVYILVGLGCLWFPMALLAYLMTDSLVVVNPVFVIRSIARAPVAYFALAALLAAILATTLLQFAIPPNLGQAGAASAPLRILIFRIGQAVLSMFTLYLAFVWTRWLGLFYRCYQDQLSWQTT
jgi:hypothetical protein